MSDDVAVQDDVVDTDAIEAQARAQGWVPEDEYKGDPKRWKSAEDFVAFGEALNPVLKKQRDAFAAETAALKAELESVRGSVADLVKARTQALVEGHNNQVAWLKEQIKAARKSGDDDVVDQLQDTLEEVRANAPKPQVQAAAPKFSPEYLQWKGRNSDWYEKDEDMTDFALGAAERIAKALPHLNGTPGFYEEVDARVRRAFPVKFKRAPDSMVDTANTNGSPRGKKDFNSLPPEVKQLAKKFLSDFPKKTKEDYARMYYEG